MALCWLTQWTCKHNFNKLASRWAGRKRLASSRQKNYILAKYFLKVTFHKIRIDSGFSNVSQTCRHKHYVLLYRISLTSKSLKLKVLWERAYVTCALQAWSARCSNGPWEMKCEHEWSKEMNVITARCQMTPPCRESNTSRTLRGC